MAESDDTCSELSYWASKLDTSVHSKHKTEIRMLQPLNSILSAFGKEECIVVGSSVEGSKVNTPADIGDVDILLISGKGVLDEEMFDYLPEYPAFILVRGTGKHLALFKDVELVDGVYLPVRLLKDLTSEFYGFVRAFVRGKSAFSLSKDETALTYSRHSAVGLELRELTGISADDIGMHYNESELDFGTFVCQLGNFMNGVIGIMKQMKSDKQSRANYIESVIARPIVAGVNTGSSFFRICSEIMHNFETFNDDNGAAALRDVTEITPETDVTELMNDSKHTPSECSSLSKLVLGDIDDDSEMQMRFENDLEAATQIQNTENSSLAENREIPELYAPSVGNSAMTKRSCDREEALHSSPNDGNGETKQPDIHVPFSRIRSIDFVPAFRMSGWPRPAEEWILRKRKWPSIEIRDQVINKGCHIVAKPLPFMSEKKNKVHFRLSFALSEVILSSSMSEYQKICWRILKAYQKGFLQLEPRVLSSYHWKTAFFWISETKPEHFWTEKSVDIAVCETLTFMLNCLNKQCVPHFFVRNMNLIACCNAENLETVKIAVAAIRENPVGYLKQFVQSPPSPPPCSMSLEELEHLKSEAKTEWIEDRSYDVLNSVSSTVNLLKEENIDKSEARERFSTGAINTSMAIKTFADEDLAEDKMGNKKILLDLCDTATRVIDVISPWNDDLGNDEIKSEFKDAGKQVLVSVGKIMLNMCGSKK